MSRNLKQLDESRTKLLFSSGTGAFNNKQPSKTQQRPEKSQSDCFFKPNNQNSAQVVVLDPSLFESVFRFLVFLVAEPPC